MKTLALGVWLAMAASIGVAAWLWRSWDPHPHAAWAAVSIASVLGTSAWLTLRALRVATRGRSPGPALGWWLIGTTPLVWFLAYAVNLYLDATHRQPMPYDTPMRMAAAWGTSFFDIEARLRYPRWTYGKQSLLIDPGDLKEPELLLEEMDEHIASMTQLLGQPPLSAPIIWIRGSIFGLKGNSTGPWAICGGDGSDALESLDRHEAAHATISLLAGPDHDPPTVLTEGWAESRSAIREEQIRNLARMHEVGDTYSLDELIDPNWYGRSQGHAYSHGGPLVHYLIGRFGGPKFFELYRDARRATFRDDCRRVLGESWDEIDADFWQWLTDENKRLAPEKPPADETAKAWKLELADDVSPADWKKLVDGCTQAKLADGTLPKRIAFAAHWNWTRADEKKHTQPITTESELTAVYDGEDFWIRVRGDRESFLMSSDGGCASLTLSRSGDVVGWVGDFKSRRRAGNEAAHLVQSYRDSSSLRPEGWLPIGDNYIAPATYRVERIERPVDGEGGPWKVAVSIQHDDDSSKYCELEIDPALDWRVIRCCHVGTPDSYTEESAAYRQIGGIWFATAGKFEANYAYARERVTAETSLRILTADEIRDLKQRVEQMALAGPTTPWRRLRRVLLAMVFAWPIVGLLCVALPTKLRQQRSYGDPSDSKEATVTATTAPTSGPTTGIQA